MTSASSSNLTMMENHMHLGIHIESSGDLFFRDISYCSYM